MKLTDDAWDNLYRLKFILNKQSDTFDNLSIDEVGDLIIKMKETIVILMKEWRTANRNEEGEKV